MSRNRGEKLQQKSSPQCGAEGTGWGKALCWLPFLTGHYETWDQLLASQRGPLLLSLCSPLLKCHWGLWARTWLGTLCQKTLLQHHLSHFQLAPPHARRSPSWGCWGSYCERCTCCWRQRGVCGSARTSARSWRRRARWARTARTPRSGSTHLALSFLGWESSRGCVEPERKATRPQGGPTLTRSVSFGSGGRWSAASQWPTSWSCSLTGCPSSGAKPWRCRCWWKTCGGCVGWSPSGGARTTWSPGSSLWGCRAETGVGPQLGTCLPLTPCDPGPCALTLDERWIIRMRSFFKPGHHGKIGLSSTTVDRAAAGKQLSRGTWMFLLSVQNRKKGLHLRYLAYTP